MPLLLLLALAACGPTDPPMDDVAGADTGPDVDPEDACDAAFTLTLPDATTAAVGCTHVDVDATFALEADVPPEVRGLGMRFAGGGADAAECTVRLDLAGVCGPGWYVFGDGATGAVVALDCPGVSGAAEGSHTLTTGAVHLVVVSGGDTPGEADHVPLYVEGSLDAASAEGVAITGTFRIAEEVAGVDVDDVACHVEATDPALDDADGDGWEGADGTGEDCDDADATVFPGAYDRPDDGVDGDCDGLDRTFDGVVLGAGDEVTEAMAYDVAGPVGLDVALVLDTSCGMDPAVYALNVEAIARAATMEGDVRWSLSTFEDYNAPGMGSLGDFPFALDMQMTDDVGAVQDALRGGLLGGGGDAPEAGMEAIYQALTGAGYDQDCDGAFDADTDVPPFIEGSAVDVFGGGAGATYDAAVSGTGSGGGVGFRDDAQPVVVLITDNYLRDPDAADPIYDASPGGCHDAGAGDVADAVEARGAWIVGVLLESTYAVDQLTALADATGRYVDEDGDGALDDAPIYPTVSAFLDDQIAAALDAVAAAALARVHYDTVGLVVAEDPYGLVSAVVPDAFTDVEAGDRLAFDLQLLGVATDAPIQTTIGLAVYGDGRLLDTITVNVEIAPE